MQNYWYFYTVLILKYSSHCKDESWSEESFMSGAQTLHDEAHTEL